MAKDEEVEWRRMKRFNFYIFLSSFDEIYRDYVEELYL